MAWSCIRCIIIFTLNEAVTDISSKANEILGKERRKKKLWVTRDVFKKLYERKDLI